MADAVADCTGLGLIQLDETFPVSAVGFLINPDEAIQDDLAVPLLIGIRRANPFINKIGNIDCRCAG